MDDKLRAASMKLVLAVGDLQNNCVPSAETLRNIQDAARLVTTTVRMNQKYETVKERWKEKEAAKEIQPAGPPVEGERAKLSRHIKYVATLVNTDRTFKHCLRNGEVFTPPPGEYLFTPLCADLHVGRFPDLKAPILRKAMRPAPSSVRMLFDGPFPHLYVISDSWEA